MNANAVGSPLGLTGFAASAQPIGGLSAGRKPRIGVLLPVPRNDQFLVVLRKGLRDAGWGADDIEFQVRRANGSAEQFRGFAQELAAMDLDVLITASTAAATALKQATSTIPIVFVGTTGPVTAGLVASMERPGGNATGTAGFSTDIAVDWVAILKEIAPQVARMAIFYNPATAARGAVDGWRIAASCSIETSEVRVDTVADIGSVVAGAAKDPQMGLIVIPHTFTFSNRDAVVAAMAEHKVASIYGIAEMVRSGGLVSYGQDLGDHWRLGAGYTDKILRGAKPEELPAQFSKNYALAINTGAAKALNLAVPPAMLSRAREVIA
ncbi:ABC transporter substrate-binding protein [Belnapia moabensis]|uniref:ABC transporter substrate-binding protein n=1 Tax=Belnapia moabensis TaxID=365533 RepID=UPI00146FF195|nr:ABC transporter substrate-binding protein [Belnapia moabensis]